MFAVVQVPAALLPSRYPWCDPQCEHGVVMQGSMHVASLLDV